MKRIKRKKAASAKLSRVYKQYFYPNPGAASGNNGVSLEQSSRYTNIRTTVSYGLLDVPPLILSDAKLGTSSQ